MLLLTVGCYFMVNSVLGAVLREGDGKLLLVHVVFRHGERTTYSFYPNDPHKNNTFYPIGLGGLTNKGKTGEYQLGQFLRAEYGDFIGEDYTESKIFVRSTDVTRTKMSAQLVLASLFPPSELQLWNPELLWQPIPIEYKPFDEEDLMHPSVCAYRKTILRGMLAHKQMQAKYVNPHQELFDYTSEMSGMEIKDLHDLLNFYFILKTEDDMNLTLPDWTSEIYPEPLYSAASLVYEYENHDPLLKQINSGYLFRKIVNDSLAKIDNKLMPAERKMFLYSGHESTLGFLMDAVGILKTHIPPYGSAIMFELYKKNGEHLVKIKYRYGNSNTGAKVLTIPGCEVLCPIKKFMRLNRELIPNLTVKDACTVRGRGTQTDG